MPEYSTDLKSTNVDIDAGIKAVLAIILAMAASFCNNRLDLVYITVYLLIATVLLKSNLRFVFKNLLSYGIIILIPYGFGILLSLLLSRLFPGPAYPNNFNPEASFFKMIKIFFIWYIGNLYFFSTPLESIMGMFNKVFSPLNSLGIPVAKYLNMIMVIIDELTRSASQFKQDILEQTRNIFKNNNPGFKTKFIELSNLLAAFIANSLQRSDKIQEQVELNRINDDQYSLRISKNEILAILSFVILLFLLYKS